MTKKVLFKGHEWFYEENLPWNYYEEGLSNNGLIHYEGFKRHTERQLREGVSFKKEDLIFI